MDNKTIIRQIFEPSIELDELEYLDVDEGTGEEPKHGKKLHRTVGTEYPLIQINGYVFADTEIKKFIIDQTSFIPTLYLKIQMSGSGQFTTAGFPKDGDIASVFVSGKDDLFKPIRNDYLITDVSTRGLNNEGVGGFITIEGTLRIPKLYDEVCISKEGTSFDVLQDIARDLNLGFASNESGTNDSMIWLSTYESYEDFLKHVKGASWKDEDSFFEVFIDIYYNINFVNVNHMFNNNSETFTALVENVLMKEALDNAEKELTEFPLVFTNLPQLEPTTNFIQSYKILNNSSRLAKKYGYKFHTVFFEQNSLEKWDIFSETLITQNSEQNSILLRGRANEDFYQSQIKKNWVGIQYSAPEHNVHENFHFARSHNMMNNIELEKLNLQILIRRLNLNIFKYQRVPCLIFLMTNALRNKSNNDGDVENFEDNQGMSIDNFYSGFFIVKGMRFIYDSNIQDETTSMREEILLSRREWPNPHS